MYFELGRSEGLPSQYGSNRTPVTVDTLEVGLIFATVILAISFYISMVSSKITQNLNLFVRVTVSLLIGAFILLGNFGQEWEIAHIESRTPYKAGSHAEINASIGLKIGLRSVNITLKSDGDAALKNEMIDYNERFEWTWEQGRFGFGPYSGHLQQTFRASQYRGLPTPILWIADYFVIDGEGFRHGRFYRTAGWYTHIALWSAFACWVLANILFRSVIRYGGYYMGMCGGLQLLANLLWITIRNPNPLIIPFEDAIIKTKYGSSFWITFISGILCISIAVCVIVCEIWWDFPLYDFFGVSVIVNVDEKYLTYDEVNLRYPKESIYEEDGIPLRSSHSNRRRMDSFVVRVKKNTYTAIKRPVLISSKTDWDNVRRTLHLEPAPLPNKRVQPPPVPKKDQFSPVAQKALRPPVPKKVPPPPVPKKP